MVGRSNGIRIRIAIRSGGDVDVDEDAMRWVGMGCLAVVLIYRRHKCNAIAARLQHLNFHKLSQQRTTLDEAKPFERSMGYVVGGKRVFPLA